MRKCVLGLCLIVSMLAVSAQVFAQSPFYNPGPVWRVSYYSIKPGMGDRYWTDINQHFKPIYDEFKKQGWVVDYKFYTNPVFEHPDDWDVAIAIEYKNWGTIDEIAGKATTIAEKHYGSRDAMIDAAKKRAEASTLVRSSLAREVTLK
jgi:hypothetical protein